MFRWIDKLTNKLLAVYKVKTFTSPGCDKQLSNIWIRQGLSTLGNYRVVVDKVLSEVMIGQRAKTDILHLTRFKTATNVQYLIANKPIDWNEEGTRIYICNEVFFLDLVRSAPSQYPPSNKSLEQKADVLTIDVFGRMALKRELRKRAWVKLRSGCPADNLYLNQLQARIDEIVIPPVQE